MLNLALHLAALTLFPLLMLGVISRTKAVLAGRRGAPVLQPYWDVLRLLRKQTVTSRTTTLVFALGPVVACVACFMAGLIVPIGEGRAPLAFAGDFILLAYLFALGRLFTAIAALDTGSSFEGMGAARDLTFACFAEIIFFSAALVLVRHTGSLSLSEMLSADLRPAWFLSAASMVLLVVGLFTLLLAETCRIPFDDPNTHLELTMVHEVMVLDHSGPGLALILFGSSLKMFVLGTLIVRVLMPGIDAVHLFAWPLLLIALLALAIGVGVVESVMARLRLIHVPRLLLGAGLLCAFSYLLSVRWP